MSRGENSSDTNDQVALLAELVRQLQEHVRSMRADNEELREQVLEARRDVEETRACHRELNDDVTRIDNEMANNELEANRRAQELQEQIG